MKLIDQIIEDATDGSDPVANTLRKCLVLAFELKNDKLKNWVERELNGYSGVEPADVPDYRQTELFSKGNFQGGFGAWMPNRPLPMGVLEKKHRAVLSPTFFREPIAAYQIESRGKGTLVINWPPDLIAIYQAKFVEGYALAQAWQEVSPGLMPAIVDTVKNRVLRFALEIRDELGKVADAPSKVPPEKVEAAVTNYIFGGNNVIGSQVSELTQTGSITIDKGDLSALKQALASIGLKGDDLSELESSLEKDKESKDEGLGKHTKSWLAKLPGKLGAAGIKAGADIAVATAKSLLLQFLGIPSA